MSILIVCGYVLATACELGGVGLVVQEVRRSRAMWARHTSDIEQEREFMQADPRSRLDVLTTRYGLTPTQIHRTIGTVERILEVDRRQQALAVGLLSTGIVVGFLTDLAETLAR